MHRNTTLLYPGAGWDASFLTLPIRKYDRYILIDSLPETPHYKEGQPGWSFTLTKERFFNVLEAAFGKVRLHDEKAGVFFFENNIEYWYNLDTNTLTPGQGPLPPKKNYDVFFSGFLPNWDKNFFGPKTLVYVYDIWDFKAVIQKKYVSKKRLVNLTARKWDDDVDDIILDMVLDKEAITTSTVVKNHRKSTPSFDVNRRRQHDVAQQQLL